MFMFPEPPPLDYYITDVSTSYLSDGIFYHGTPAPSHKYVAKQLKPIKRTVLSDGTFECEPPVIHDCVNVLKGNILKPYKFVVLVAKNNQSVEYDPIAPIQELSSYSLERQLMREKELYVNSPVHDNGLVYQTLRVMPKWPREQRLTQNAVFSIFPRSQQYELWYIRDRRLKNGEKLRETLVECKKKEEKLRTDDEPCALMKPPIWWKDKQSKPRGVPIGNANDYTYEKLAFEQEAAKLSERLEIDHPKKYVPGVIHRIQNPEDTSMKDALERSDAFEPLLKKDNILSKIPPVDERLHPSEKYPCCGSKEDRSSELVARSPKILHGDRRWQLPVEYLSFPKTEFKRGEELRKLSKPFSHDLHMWYLKNKPTKLIVPPRHPGKRPIPEMRFSHL